MKSVLVIGHGSRIKETEATMEAIVDMVKAKLPETIIDFAFMEMSDRTIEKGIAALAAQGASEIRVVPYFLFKGVHPNKDIPELIARCAEDYPDIAFSQGETLGVDERLADVLVERILA